MQSSHLVKRIRKIPRRWRKRIAIRLGLAPRLADRGYMVCTSGRSGSIYLCRLLASTGVLGNANEYFDYHSKSREFPGYPKHPRNQIKHIRTAGATANGVYGVKVFPWHLRQLGKRRVDPLHELPNLSLVRLIRRDVLGAAISLTRVAQSQQYTSSMPERAPAVYDQQEIRRWVAVRLKADAYWESLFRERSIQPLTLEYETVMQDPQAAVDAIAALVGVPLPAPIDQAKIGLTVQRDEINREWRRRFLAETGDEFRHLA